MTVDDSFTRLAEKIDQLIPVLEKFTDALNQSNTQKEDFGGGGFQPTGQIDDKLMQRFFQDLTKATQDLTRTFSKEREDTKDENKKRKEMEKNVGKAYIASQITGQLGRGVGTALDPFSTQYEKSMSVIKQGGEAGKTVGMGMMMKGNIAGGAMVSAISDIGTKIVEAISAKERVATEYTKGGLEAFYNKYAELGINAEDIDPRLRESMGEFYGKIGRTVAENKEFAVSQTNLYSPSSMQMLQLGAGNPIALLEQVQDMKTKAQALGGSGG